MTDTEIQWLKDVYKHYIMTGRASLPGKGFSRPLHCDHWGNLIYLKVKAKFSKEILSHSTHSVCAVDGVLVDLELNAFIEDFDWKTRAIDSKVRFKPINPEFPVLRDEIFRYYSTPATESHHLWHNRVF